MSMRDLRLYIMILQSKQLLVFMVGFKHIYIGVVSHIIGNHTINRMYIQHMFKDRMNCLIDYHDISFTHYLLISNGFYGFYYKTIIVFTPSMTRCNL